MKNKKKKKELMNFKSWRSTVFGQPMFKVLSQKLLVIKKEGTDGAIILYGLCQTASIHAHASDHSSYEDESELKMSKIQFQLVFHFLKRERKKKRRRDMKHIIRIGKKNSIRIFMLFLSTLLLKYTHFNI